MIRYDISKQQLEQKITQESSTWLKRAKNRTNKFKKNGTYSESSSIWSEVKVVYMKLQYEKCIFCERKLEATEKGKIEQDVEHFRPKSNVSDWAPNSSTLKQQLKAKITQAPSKNGYFLLPYHPFNYAASCKPCNSVMKNDFFPVAAKYELSGEDPEVLNSTEKPYLIYPIGSIDENPENLIHFFGVSPMAVAKRGHDRYRALVNIDFFYLDSLTSRKNLIRERALILLALYPQLHGATSNDAATRNRARDVVEKFVHESAPHTNCARSFMRLFQSSPAKATEVFNGLTQYLITTS